jgi:vitamin B12 transporter
VGLRSDNYDSFPTAKSWRVTPLYTIRETSTKLKASVGTAFRAPSLFERHGSTPTNFGTAYNGNPLLEPEENRGWEVGVEQAFSAGRIEPRVTYYRNRITNLIKTVFLPSFDSTSVNIDHATTEGYESGVAWRFSDRAALQMEYTRTRTLDQNGQELLRRPREMVRVEVRSNITAEVEVTPGLRYTGRRKDVDRVSGATIETGGYAVTNLAVSWRLSKNIRAHGRTENLFDKRYEPIDGFKGIRRVVYAGMEASF